jgi:toxin ParE1/3/4
VVANQQVELILLAVDRLPDFPERGRPGRWNDTRELVVIGTSYIVAYRNRNYRVEVLAVIHAARRWPQTMY